MGGYHTSVLVDEVVEFMNIRDKGVYVDCTVGGGGHSKAMLMANPSIRLFCFDQDEEAIKAGRMELGELEIRNEKLEIENPPYPCPPLHPSQEGKKRDVKFFRENFKGFRTRLALEKVDKVDGILMDIGVSNHQISDGKRGFSFMQDSKLDMRMDRRQKLSAYEVVNTYSYEELCRIFFEYGEERYSKKIANSIVKQREHKKIKTTKELAEIVEGCVSWASQGAGDRNKGLVKSKARVFQAIRIEVNKELEVLGDSLKDAIRALKPEGRLVVISWHSLEDRIVKESFLRAAGGCNCPMELPVCECNNKAKVKILTKKPIVPSEKEIGVNSNARSAKLRVVVKL